MSSSQATQATEAIDTPITLAQFLKNWVAGRYRNLIDWGTTIAGNRVTTELQLYDKRGRPTGKWQPISLLITDLTSKTTDLLAGATIIQPLNTNIGATNAQLLKGPPTGKTNWRRIIIQNIGGLNSNAIIYILPDASSATGSAMHLLGSPFLAFSGATVTEYQQPLVLDNFASSIWAVANAPGSGLLVLAYA